MKALFAYPGAPVAIGQCISAAISKLNAGDRWSITPWPEVDNWGKPLIAPILMRIAESDCVIADITRLNFNVTFELGYSIGAKKRVLPVINSGLKTDEEYFSSIGIYDSLGFKKYESSEQLAALLEREILTDPIAVPSFRDTEAPLFLLETPVRSDDLGRIISQINRSLLRYRSFSRSEEQRLPAVWAIDQVSKSFGVVVPLCSSEVQGAFEHNLKAAFVAGLALGMGRKTIVLQSLGGPAPADVRDELVTYRELSDIDDRISSICYQTHQLLHEVRPAHVPDTGVLSLLSIGDPLAENEFATLGNYYVRTDQFYRTRRGEVNLVTGRKGTGKTALFGQIRDDVARFNNLVVELKPEGYQLLKVKEEVLRDLEQGSVDHLITAFWEYLIYMEIASKALEVDSATHYKDQREFALYEGLRTAFERDKELSTSGDFSERLNILAAGMATRYAKILPEGGRSLNQAQVTEIVHSYEISSLRQALESYLVKKDEVWLLFDNLDKGWTPGGVTQTDILMLRCLLDAMRKIRNDLRRSVEEFNGVVFVRNDVYQLLLDESPDFGKDARANLDWRDRSTLRQVLAARLEDGLKQLGETPRDVFTLVCVPRIGLHESIDYMIDMSLMRPRNLIKLFNYARGVAVNRRHTIIEADDILEGVRILSDDVLADCTNELRDVFSHSKDFLYRFLNELGEFSREEVGVLALEHGISTDHLDTLIEHLLYYGVFGIRTSGEGIMFVYDLSYDMKRVKMLIEKYPGCSYVVHPVLRPSLRIRA
jgi:hypothetical protein